MRWSSTTLITDVPEIDLYECLKYDQMRNLGQLRTYLPHPHKGYVYIQLCQTRVRYGMRIWFQAPCCNRRTTKLYIYGTRIACRKCLDLKYPSQYRKDWSGRSAMTYRKLERLRKQRRRLGYGDGPTRFGVQFRKLRDESYGQSIELLNDMRTRRMKLDAQLAAELNQPV